MLGERNAKYTGSTAWGQPPPAVRSNAGRQIIADSYSDTFIATRERSFAPLDSRGRLSPRGFCFQLALPAAAFLACAGLSASILRILRRRSAGVKGFWINDTPGTSMSERTNSPLYPVM